MKEDKQEHYREYVVQELVNDTDVDIRDLKIWHPYDSHYSRHLIGGVSGAFIDYVEDKFGILPQEVNQLWEEYKTQLKKEHSWIQIEPYDSRGEAIRFAMRESRKHNKGNEEFKRIDNPTQHKLYNKIADKVVSLIEVRDSDRVGKIIYLTDLLDPKYPGQGAPLIDPINIPDYEAFQKRMMPIINDFFPMLEHYWYIEDLFSKIFILTRFVFPKIWNKFYKGEDQAEESTDYGEHALDYEEDMGKEKINESTSLIDAVVKDMVKNTRTEVSEFSLRTVYVPTNNAIYNFDLLHNLDRCPNYLYNYIQDTYGLTTDEIELVWVKYKKAIMGMLKDTDSNNPFAITEDHKSTNKLIDKVYNEISDSLILTDETIELHFPYFRNLNPSMPQPAIYYDPFHSNVGKFDTNYVLSELKRFVAFHLLKTMGIGEKLQYRDYDPMVDPIAKKLLKDIYKKAVLNGFVQYDSLDTLGLNETKIRKTEDREYHRNGFINRVVKDILKRVELTLNEIVFDVVRDYGLTIDKPKIIYNYGEEGLSRDSVTVIRDAVPSMVHWYLSKHDLSSGGEDPTVDIIASILSDIIIEKIVEFQEDEDWDDYKETWVLGESKKITFIDKVTQRVIDTIEEDEDHYYFKEISRPSYDTFKGEYGNKFSPLSVKKNGLNNELRSDWLYNKLKDFYGGMYGLREEEMLELYNNILYHILKERRLNSLNPVIIGDWDLEYSPSLQINKEDWESFVDKDYNLRNLEDYIAMINFMGYDKVGDDVELYRNENNISYQDKYTEGWTKEDFKPFHQDLVNSLENYHGQKL